jgi:arabinose-5-phosphate isomerase
MNNIKGKIEQSNEIFFDFLNNEHYNVVKEIVEKSDDVIFCGVGKNWYICEKIVKTWLSMGIKCESLDCVHALHGDLGMLQNNFNKVIFFVSKSGNTEEMVKLLNIINDLKDKGILKNLITVGFNMNNKVDKSKYDYCLTPSSIPYNEVKEFDERNLVPSLSINTMQMVLDVMGVEIFENNPKMVENYKYNHLAGANGRRLGGDKYMETVTN